MRFLILALLLFVSALPATAAAQEISAMFLGDNSPHQPKARFDHWKRP
jgi:hypothetical protein